MDNEFIDNGFILHDRMQKIQQIITKYGEENFYISFSGGKDSTVLSFLIDLALPNNQIPRVYINTGIEFNAMVEHVTNLSYKDNRIIIIKPSQNIRSVLENYGYPFKSKHHAATVANYQKNPDGLWPSKYVNGGYNWAGGTCPKCLKYQFTPEFNLKISDKCCFYLKEKPLDTWAKEHNKKYHIIGVMASEGGRRSTAKCLSFRNNKLHSFQPLSPLNKEWEDWLINKFNIQLCKLYYPPYNFERTGCKGCPFNIKLQNELNVLEELLPAERKQCEIIWKPVYDEYRRIHYRLKEVYKNDNN